MLRDTTVSAIPSVESSSTACNKIRRFCDILVQYIMLSRGQYPPIAQRQGLARCARVCGVLVAGARSRMRDTRIRYTTGSDASRLPLKNIHTKTENCMRHLNVFPNPFTSSNREDESEGDKEHGTQITLLSPYNLRLRMALIDHAYCLFSSAVKNQTSYIDCTLILAHTTIGQ